MLQPVIQITLKPRRAPEIAGSPEFISLSIHERSCGSFPKYFMPMGLSFPFLIREKCWGRCFILRPSMLHFASPCVLQATPFEQIIRLSKLTL